MPLSDRSLTILEDLVGEKNNIEELFKNKTFQYFLDEYEYVQYLTKMIREICADLWEKHRDELTVHQKQLLLDSIKSTKSDYMETMAKLVKPEKDTQPLFIQNQGPSKTLIVSNYEALEKDILKEIEAPNSKRERVVSDE